jgi:hypothetical protein
MEMFDLPQSYYDEETVTPKRDGELGKTYAIINLSKCATIFC